MAAAVYIQQPSPKPTSQENKSYVPEWNPGQWGWWMEMIRRTISWRSFWVIWVASGFPVCKIIDPKMWKYLRWLRSHKQKKGLHFIFVSLGLEETLKGWDGKDDEGLAKTQLSTTEYSPKDHRVKLGLTLDYGYVLPSKFNFQSLFEKLIKTEIWGVGQRPRLNAKKCYM